jgi:hypothetical protein
MDLQYYIDLSDKELNDVVIALAKDAGTPQETKDVLLAMATHWSAAKAKVKRMQKIKAILTEDLNG